MRREVSSGGAWLAGAGIAAALAYLSTTAAAGGHHPAWPYFLFSAVVVTGAGLYLLGSRSQSSTAVDHGARAPAPGQTRALKGRITHLQDQSRVEHKQLVSGEVAGVPADAEPWLLVRPVLDGVFYPQQKLSPDMNGQFRSMAYFGRSADRNRGEEFLLLLVLARPQASKLLSGKLNAAAYIKELPQDVQVLDQRTVIRQ
jgi:hypothetical protein